MRIEDRPPIRLAQIVDATRSEGPGKRCAIWFQGCPLRCPGCCNPEMLPFEGGVEWNWRDLKRRIENAATAYGLEGVTLLGGEPFAHSDAGAEIAELAQKLSLTVMVFSGFTLAEIRRLSDSGSRRLLAAADLLVDGLYDERQRTTSRRWIGSDNQQLHFLSDRYSAEDPCWRAANTVEFRLESDEIVVSGFPDARAVESIRQWRRGR